MIISTGREQTKKRGSGKKAHAQVAIGVNCPRMLQAKSVLFDLDQFGLESGSLNSGKRKWVVSNMAGTRTYANLGVSEATSLLELVFLCARECTSIISTGREPSWDYLDVEGHH